MGLITVIDLKVEYWLDHIKQLPDRGAKAVHAAVTKLGADHAVWALGDLLPFVAPIVHAQGNSKAKLLKLLSVWAVLEEPGHYAAVKAAMGCAYAAALLDDLRARYQQSTPAGQRRFTLSFILGSQLTTAHIHDLLDELKLPHFSSPDTKAGKLAKALNFIQQQGALLPDMLARLAPEMRFALKAYGDLLALRNVLARMGVAPPVTLEVVGEDAVNSFVFQGETHLAPGTRRFIYQHTQPQTNEYATMLLAFWESNPGRQLRVYRGLLHDRVVPTLDKATAFARASFIPLQHAPLGGGREATRLQQFADFAEHNGRRWGLWILHCLLCSDKERNGDAWEMFEYWQQYFEGFRFGNVNTDAACTALQQMASHPVCPGCHLGKCANVINSQVTFKLVHQVLRRVDRDRQLPADTTLGEHLRFKAYKLVKGRCFYGRERVNPCLLTSIRFWFPGGCLTGFRSSAEEADDLNADGDDGDDGGAAAAAAASPAPPPAAAAAAAALSDDDEEEAGAGFRCAIC